MVNDIHVNTRYSYSIIPIGIESFPIRSIIHDLGQKGLIGSLLSRPTQGTELGPQGSLLTPVPWASLPVVARAP